MTLLVGYTDSAAGAAALEFGAVLARSSGRALVVTTVVAAPHLPSEVPVDGDYRRLLTTWAEGVLARAAAAVPTDVQATFEVRVARSIPAGLTELAQEHAVAAVVLGSSKKGKRNRISLGSVTDRMVHGSTFPVILVPRTYRGGPTTRVDRVSVAVAGASDMQHLLRTAGDWALVSDVPVRVVSFLPRPMKRAQGTIEPAADDLVIERWARRTQEELESQLDALDRLPGVQGNSALVVGSGVSWRSAVAEVPWSDGELLVVGSTRAAPRARVFLGSRASKILRHSPVPVMTAPNPGVETPAREAAH